jgi:hypothetical protein
MKRVALKRVALKRASDVPVASPRRAPAGCRHVYTAAQAAQKIAAGASTDEVPARREPS